MNMMSNIARTLMLLIVFCGVSFAIDYPESVNERHALAAVRTIHSAEMTYFVTNGNGHNYGSLRALRHAQLIDPALGTGNKYGYVFVVSLTPGTSTSPASFTLTATPRVYRRSARWSFFVGVNGEIHGADKHGEPATENDPILDTCSNGSIAENERCIIQSMRTVHSSEVTYYATSGNGNYGGLSELRSSGLINESLASGQLRGYSISVSTFSESPNLLARFRAIAVPQIYGTTGIRSFFVDETGVIRGADHQGGPANENDPIINIAGSGSIAENEQRTIAGMRTVHSAEITYFALYGSYAALAELASAGLIDPVLASGQLNGYSISVAAFLQTYSASAIPQTYGTTGIRSFFVDENGVIRAADHQGGPANENDPPI